MFNGLTLLYIIVFIVFAFFKEWTEFKKNGNSKTIKREFSLAGMFDRRFKWYFWVGFLMILLFEQTEGFFLF